MKAYCFILSHKGAGSKLLARILNTTNKMAVLTDSNIIYDHLDSLELLNNKIQTHQYVKSYTPIYCDTLTQNTDLYCHQLFDFCKFIYLLRPPEPTIKHLAYEKSYDYYRFRLRRLYEYSKHTKDNSIVITYDDIISRRAFPLIEEFLNIKDVIGNGYNNWPWDSGDLAAGKILDNIEQDNLPPINSDKYEKYLNRIRGNSSFVL